MWSFKQYLIEAFNNLIQESLASDTQHITHLSHAEDLGHEYGHAGAEHSFKALHAAADHVEHGAYNSNLTTKVDGGVSIVAGHHPHTGKFFVGYKGAIKHIGGEKESKLAYSHHDIEHHFADKPYLVDKLKTAFDHVHKILPKHGVYQGDMLFTHHDKHDEGNKVSFTPNTITYSAKHNSVEGKKIGRAKMGISFHTAYKHKEGSLHSNPVDHDELKQHEDVYHLSTANDTHRAHFSEQDKHEFHSHLGHAKSIHEKHGHAMYDAIHPVADHISTYINKTVREGTKPTAEGLQAHIHGHHAAEAAKLKTEAGKAKKVAAGNQVVQHIESNKEHFKNYLEMHHHIQHAKNKLVDVLDKADHPLEHHIGKEKAAPEGYVFHHEGVPIKLVSREKFSKANFAKPRD